jgi:hypothetical protein
MGGCGLLHCRRRFAKRDLLNQRGMLKKERMVEIKIWSDFV